MKILKICILFLVVNQLTGFSQIKIGFSSGTNFSKLYSENENQYELTSKPKIGCQIELNISKKTNKEWLFFKSAIIYSHYESNTKIHTWSLAGDITNEGIHKINSIDLLFGTDMRIFSKGIYISPGIYIGYAKCQYAGLINGYVGYDRYHNENVEYTQFSEIELGFNIGINYKKRFLDTYEFVIGTGYSTSINSFTLQKFGYSSWLINIGLNKYIN